ncbi:hypothetical protein PHMEG_00019754 [Phytophthora megakarya]|uniref:Uncharacterized protein n=1 Tax=Phytophthora megakarya TaxID=4795 RepID=A0A225VTF7_9STRA|nr:hypothetical protein PHMEG_00019754 [Phytophthora megakarya]
MKRMGRTPNQTLESRRLNNREDLTETTCGDMTHSTNFCRRRCKLCKQVREPRRCEVFQELTKLVRTKVDKTYIAPEL